MKKTIAFKTGLKFVSKFLSHLKKNDEDEHNRKKMTKLNILHYAATENIPIK